jgi:hypothetical protein
MAKPNALLHYLLYWPKKARIESRYAADSDSMRSMAESFLIASFGDMLTGSLARRATCLPENITCDFAACSSFSRSEGGSNLIRKVQAIQSHQKRRSKLSVNPTNK